MRWSGPCTVRIAKTSALTEDRERAALDTIHRQSRGIQQYNRLEAALTWLPVSSDRLKAYPAHQHIRQTGLRQTAQSPSSTSNQLVLHSLRNSPPNWAAQYSTNPLHTFETSTPPQTTQNADPGIRVLPLPQADSSSHLRRRRLQRQQGIESRTRRCHPRTMGPQYDGAVGQG